MATMTGKAARRRGGNRYACKRANRKRNPAKIARWQAMEKDRNKGARGRWMDYIAGKCGKNGGKVKV